MRKNFTVLFIAGVLFAGCSFMNGVRGNGHVVSEDRDIENFTNIDVGGAFDVKVAAGEETSLKIEAEENLLRYITTEVEGGTLLIGQKKNLSPRKSLKIFITTETLKGADVSGASELTVRNISTGVFDLEISGACKVALSGKVDKLTADISGASKLKADKLIAADVNIDVSGASKASVYAANSIISDCSGASKIIYYGDPKSVSSDVSAASSVERK